MRSTTPLKFSSSPIYERQLIPREHDNYGPFRGWEVHAEDSPYRGANEYKITDSLYLFLPDLIPGFEEENPVRDRDSEMQNAAVEVAAPDLVPGEARPFGLQVGGAAIHAGGKRIAPQLYRHGVEYQRGSDDPLVAHLLTQTELLGEVEADGILWAERPGLGLRRADRRPRRSGWRGTRTHRRRHHRPSAARL